MEKNLGTTQNAPIVKVGHTVSGVFGSETTSKTKGRSGRPADLNFGGSSK
jgi:hypothetical protein